MGAHFLAAVLMSAQLAAPAATILAAQETPAVIPEDWTRAHPERRIAVDVAEQYMAAERAEALAVPRRHEADTIRGDKYAKFASEFAEAKVPGCLRPDGLKRQSTYGFRELLALPFIVVAKVRGKCM